MKPLLRIGFVLLCAASGAAGLLIASRGESADRPAARLPSAAIVLLEAVPFVLDEPFVHEWRAEQPLQRAGYLLALEVDPDLARPRQTYEPVLYVGQETAERINAPEHGRLIVLVPAPVDAAGQVVLDLDRAPIWFGSLELPERVDGARIAQELAIARAAGIGPARKSEQLTGLDLSARTIHARSRPDLDAYLADLVERYSPEELDRISALRGE